MKQLSLFLIMLAVCTLDFGVGAHAVETADVAGKWVISLTYVAGTSTHTTIIEQENGKLSGDYKGEFLEGKLSGSVEGSKVTFTGRLRHEATGVRYRYEGTVDGDTMKGTVDMGEYWTADFTAKRKK